MIQGVYSAASALNAYSFAQNVRAVNVANLNTDGFRSMSVTFSELRSGGTTISNIRRAGSEGYLLSTGRNLDLSINGAGYFKVSSDGGDKFLRSGSFSLDADGNLVASDGSVLAENVSDEEGRVDVSDDGRIIVNGEERGQLQLYNQSGDVLNPEDYEIRSGFREASNVDAAREIVAMMINTNSFALNASALRTNDEMLGLIINIKG